MPSPFLPSNWYWFVAADAARVYSSAVGDYVATTDAAYVSWAQTNSTSHIDSETSLGDVLASRLAELTKVTSAVLVIAQALKQERLNVLLRQNADMVAMVQGGSVSTLTGTQVANYLASATNNYRSLRAQIAVATSAAAVDAININAGWPQNP